MKWQWDSSPHRPRAHPSILSIALAVVLFAGLGRTGKIVGEELGQTERGAREQVGGGVGRGVPALVDGRVFEPEIGREVDNRRASVDEPGGHRQRRRMRNGEEHEVARIESRVVMGGEGEVGGAGEAGVFARDGRAGQLVRGDSDELEVGMAQGDPRQLDAGEPRRAYDARRDRHVDRLRSARHGAARFVSALRSICASAQIEAVCTAVDHPKKETRV